MKNKFFISIAAVCIVTSASVFFFFLLTLDDRAKFLNEEVETLLKDRLTADKLELTYSVDFKKKCDYWYAILYLQDNDLYLALKDCSDKIAGIKNLGVKIISATNADKSMLVYYALSEMISNPYKNNIQPESHVSTEVQQEETTEYADYQTNPAQHNTRYFFAPSSFNLEEGDLYYNSLYFFLHDLQYGISDEFSIGLGTTLIGFPFYVTPKITLPFNDKSSFAIGDMLLLGTWDSDFFGNLLYGTYTRGDSRNNITVGGGHLYTRPGDLTSTTNSPVVNFSALGQISDHIYFITENYASKVKTRQDANYFFFDNVSGNYVYDEAVFNQDVFFIYGMTGFRFINKKRDVISWQVGLTYLFRAPEEVPVQYTTGNWSTSANNENKFITFPVIGFTRKFGVKY